MRTAGTGQFKASTPDLTLNGGLFREWYQDGLRFYLELKLFKNHLAGI